MEIDSDLPENALAQWALTEVAPGRLVPWLAVAFGFGIVGYFGVDREPAWWAATSAVAVTIAIAYAARLRPVGFPLALGAAAIAAGFAVATLKTAYIAHPVLQFTASSVTLSGFVEVREERERSDRVVIHVHHLEGRRLDEVPDRVRVAVRKGTAPAVGSFVELKAHLSPPLAPLRPGGYDFARDMYFQRIGASGYALGKIQTVTPPIEQSRWLRIAAAIDFMREAIDKRIRAGALAAAGFYLVLSGAGVATQRSFVMIAIVLVGVMADRRALTFRTLTIAALAVLLLAPQSVLHPSFQMSFAATVALIAGYQYGLPWRANADTSVGARVALWGGREVVTLLFASLIAGLATTPYAAYHFHRLAPYGVLANLLAMPAVSVWVMPMGILGILAMPFGFDAIFWRLMGEGIDWMIGVVLWVDNLPGAVGRIQAFGTGPLLIGTAGLLLLCLLRSPLRWSGAGLAVVASLWAVMTPRPDVLVAADGQVAAVRGPSGSLSILHSGRDTFATKEWLAADGDARAVKDATLHDGVRCDPAGCIGHLPDGRMVSFAQSVEAFAEDCRRAAVVASPHEAPGGCQALLIDRKAWLGHGATALRWTGDRFEQVEARPSGYERPSARDATPRQEDMEEGD